MAARQLTWMFEAADDGFLRHDIIRAVRALGDDARSASLATESRPAGPLDHDELWARVLRGTLAPPPPGAGPGPGG
jgi:hypothetical protein